MQFPKERIDRAQGKIEELKASGNVRWAHLEILRKEINEIINQGAPDRFRLEQDQNIPILLDYFNGRIELNRAFSLISRQLRSKNGKSARVAAAGALILLGAEIIPKVIELLEYEEDPNVRENLSYVLGYFGGEAGLKCLIHSFSMEPRMWKGGLDPLWAAGRGNTDRYSMRLRYRIRDILRVADFYAGGHDDFIFRYFREMLLSEDLKEVEAALLAHQAYFEGKLEYSSSAEFLVISGQVRSLRRPEDLVFTVNLLNESSSKKRVLLLTSVLFYLRVFHVTFLIYNGVNDEEVFEEVLRDDSDLTVKFLCHVILRKFYEFKEEQVADEADKTELAMNVLRGSEHAPSQIVAAHTLLDLGRKDELIKATLERLYRSTTSRRERRDVIRGFMKYGDVEHAIEGFRMHDKVIQYEIMNFLEGYYGEDEWTRIMGHLGERMKELIRIYAVDRVLWQNCRERGWESYYKGEKLMRFVYTDWNTREKAKS